MIRHDIVEANPESGALLVYYLGWAPALPSIIRLHKRGLRVTNTLAYYVTELITTVKIFIVQGPIL